MVVSSIHMTFIFDSRGILWVEIRCQSLLAVKSDRFKDFKALNQKSFLTQKIIFSAIIRAVTLFVCFFLNGALYGEGLSS